MCLWYVNFVHVTLVHVTLLSRWKVYITRTKSDVSLHLAISTKEKQQHVSIVWCMNTGNTGHVMQSEWNSSG